MTTQRTAKRDPKGRAGHARRANDKTTKAGDKGAERPRPAPLVGAEPFDGEANKPDYEALFRGLVERANQGEPEALARLRKFLDLNPCIWEKAGDLTAAAERAWTELIAGADRLAAESLRRRLARLKAELAGPHPALESLLVDQVAVSWLAAHDGEIRAAVAGGAVAQAALRLRRAESGQRRLLNAVKTLSTLRALTARGLAPLDSVRLFKSEREPA